MNGLLDGLPLDKQRQGQAQCAEHNCPMLKIGDEYCCVIGHTNACIGMQRAVGLVIPDESEGGPARLAFANGYTLPLICPICGDALNVTSVAVFNNLVQGLYLFALSYIPPGGELGDELGSLELMFASEDVLNSLGVLDSLLDDSSDPPPEEKLEDVEYLEGIQTLKLHLDSVRGLHQAKSGTDV